MSLFLLFTAFNAPISAVVDQTTDVSIVAEYLHTIRVQKIDGGGSFVKDIRLNNLDDNQMSTPAAFTSYANGCALAEISTIKNGLPLNVEWTCHLSENRHANFWITNGKITRIQWGHTPTLIIKPLEEAK